MIHERRFQIHGGCTIYDELENLHVIKLTQLWQMISISFKNNWSILKFGEVQDLNGCMLQNEFRYHITMYSLQKKNWIYFVWEIETLLCAYLNKKLHTTYGDTSWFVTNLNHMLMQHRWQRVDLIVEFRR